MSKRLCVYQIGSYKLKRCYFGVSTKTPKTALRSLIFENKQALLGKACDRPVLTIVRDPFVWARPVKWFPLDQREEAKAFVKHLVDNPPDALCPVNVYRRTESILDEYREHNQSKRDTSVLCDPDLRERESDQPPNSVVIQRGPNDHTNRCGRVEGSGCGDQSGVEPDMGGT